MSSPRGRGWLRMLAVGTLVVAADQLSKALIVDSLAPGERIDLALGTDLVRVTNSGIAFGLLDEAGDSVVLAITLAALALIAGWFSLDAARPGLWLGVGLLLGGAVGNLIDRIRLEGVTDFLDPPLWPAFNLADVAITAGVALMLLVAFSAPAGPAPTAEP